MPEKKNKIICMISCRHNLLDDRIYKKEAVSLSKEGFDLIHIGYGEAAQDYFTKENIRIIQLKKIYKKERIKAFKQLHLNDLYQTAKELHADVYHLHDVELCRIAVKLKKLPWNPKVIYDAHEPFCENLKDYWKERSLMKVFFNDIPSVFAEKRILSKVDYLIATEKNVYSRFLKKNPNTSIVHNYSYFSPVNSVDKNAIKEFDAIYCGTISESKGIFLMIEALIEARKKQENLRFVIVGGFSHISLQQKIEKIIQQENLEKHLFFTGELPLEKISSYYNKSKTAFCLFPLNRTNQLILPIKLFEYAAFGLPIIGSDFGHIKEIIEQNKIGITVNPHNAENVADALIQLISDDKYKNYHLPCINCVGNKYLWEKEEEKLLQIYNQLLRFS